MTNLERDDSQGNELERWRVGGNYSIHVYTEEPDPSTGKSRPVGTFFRAEDAHRAVHAHNIMVSLSRPPDRWVAQVVQPEPE